LSVAHRNGRQPSAQILKLPPRYRTGCARSAAAIAADDAVNRGTAAAAPAMADFD